MFIGLFGMWGGFAAPSLYLAMNISIFSFLASVPLSIFLVMNNTFWGSVSKNHKYSTHPAISNPSTASHLFDSSVLDHSQPYLIAKRQPPPSKTPSQSESVSKPRHKHRV